MKGMGRRVEMPTVAFPEVFVSRITDKAKEHLHATYYGISPFNKTQRYIAVLETTVQDRLPTKEDVATLGLVDLKTKEFIPIAETRAWNFQQGCMAHWLDENEIIFNDIREGNFVSIIKDVASGEEEIIPRPISAVFPGKRMALSINYARLRLARPDYGYDGEGEDPKTDDPYPDDDGLFVVDLEGGKSELILSIYEVKEFLGLPEDIDSRPLMRFEHTLFNKDGRRIFFLARVQRKGGGFHTASMTVASNGKELRACFPSPWEWSGSHFDWLASDKLMVTARYKGKKWCPILFTDGKGDYEVLGKGLLDHDGHGTFSPNGKWMAMDRYRDALGNQSLFLMDMETNAVLSLGNFFEPPRFFNPQIPGYWRCDLHPCWSPNGDMIAINSTHEGTRQVYLISLRW
jgi:hypothetical protein